MGHVQSLKTGQPTNAWATRQHAPDWCNAP
jgi:hypothetical protein